MEPQAMDYPSAEAAQQRRIQNIRSGDQSQNITNAMPMSLERYGGQAMADRLNSGDAFTRPPSQSPIGWDMADRMQAAKMAADTSPSAYLGFDPSQMSYSKNTKLTVAGATEPESKRIWFSADDTHPSVAVHESMHRGHKLMLEDPEGKQVIEEFGRHWSNPEEQSVRANMIRRYGDVEMGGGSLNDEQVARAREALKNPEFRKGLRSIDRVAHRMVADKVIREAGGVR